MIYKFKSKAAGDVIMMGPNGDQVLRILGKEPAAQGIIPVAAMPAAIQAIEQAVSADESSGRPDEAPEGGEEERSEGRAGVRLRQRAWPLLEMMKRAHGAGEDIVWGV